MPLSRSTNCCYHCLQTTPKCCYPTATKCCWDWLPISTKYHYLVSINHCQKPLSLTNNYLRPKQMPLYQYLTTATKYHCVWLPITTKPMQCGRLSITISMSIIHYQKPLPTNCYQMPLHQRLSTATNSVPSCNLHTNLQTCFCSHLH